LKKPLSIDLWTVSTASFEGGGEGGAAGGAKGGDWRTVVEDAASSMVKLPGEPPTSAAPAISSLSAEHAS
jgi:hypothetical protein